MSLGEPSGTALVLLAAGFLLSVSVLVSRFSGRLGLPFALMFLGLGMLAGSEGIGGIAFDDYGLAFRLGTLALVLILFHGGLSTPVARLRDALLPAGLLATVGVIITAGLVAVAARTLGFTWPAALLLGAVVSSTDAAAVYAELRGGGVQLKRRLGTTLELESGLNDPMAMVLTTTLTGLLAVGAVPGPWSVVSVVWQLVLGTLLGVVFGLAGRVVLGIRLPASGLYPVLSIGLALAGFGVSTLLQGSGFMTVYVAGFVVGNGKVPYARGLERVHDALAWLSQVGMFLLLGLLVFPSRLLAVAPAALALALFMAVVARPVAVLVCLAPFRFAPRELVYIGWVGLRGSVPIILATFPVMAGVENAELIFNAVFFLVVVNALLPGATVRWLTRKLGLGGTAKLAPAAVLEMVTTERLRGEIVSYLIQPPSAACGAAVRDLPFPEEALALLIVRGRALLAPRGSMVLQAGDHVYVFCLPEDLPELDLIFGTREER